MALLERPAEFGEQATLWRVDHFASQICQLLKKCTLLVVEIDGSLDVEANEEIATAPPLKMWNPFASEANHVAGGRSWFDGNEFLSVEGLKNDLGPKRCLSEGHREFVDEIVIPAREPTIGSDSQVYVEIPIGAISRTDGSTPRKAQR
jgi:hypothetical protein